jgi:hypothetical protein
MRRLLIPNESYAKPDQNLSRKKDPGVRNRKKE